MSTYCTDWLTIHQTHLNTLPRPPGQAVSAIFFQPPCPLSELLMMTRGQMCWRPRHYPQALHPNLPHNLQVSLPHLPGGHQCPGQSWKSCAEDIRDEINSSPRRINYYFLKPLRFQGLSVSATDITSTNIILFMDPSQPTIITPRFTDGKTEA